MSYTRTLTTYAKTVYDKFSEIHTGTKDRKVIIILVSSGQWLAFDASPEAIHMGGLLENGQSDSVWGRICSSENPDGKSCKAVVECKEDMRTIFLDNETELFVSFDEATAKMVGWRMKRDADSLRKHKVATR